MTVHSHRVGVGVAVAALAVAALVDPTRSLPEANATPGRPNILIILTDDQRDQGTLDVMPYTRQIFQQGGTTFTNAFDSTPLCCPARGSLWSGRFSHNHGVLTNGDNAAENRYDQTTTIQYDLSQAGYMTALVGKYWNTWPRSTPPPYFQRFAMMSGGYTDVGFNVDGSSQMTSGNSTEAIGTYAVSFLQSFEANDDQPWFMYIAPHAPHSPFEPSATYQNAPVPPWDPSPAVLEADRSDKPASVRNNTVSISAIDAVRADQLRTLMSVDDMVKQVFDEMDVLGEQDTLAFFLTDNGYMWGEHGLEAKRFPYVDSIGIPMLMRWPGQVPAGVVDDRLVEQIDIEPTILQVLGITPNHPVDGVSLFAPGGRQRIYLEYTQSPDSPGIGSWGADLTDSYEYVEWWDASGAVTFREYYDLVNDPWQLTNLYGDGDPTNDPSIQRLSPQLGADRICAGATCPQPVVTTPDTEPPTAPGQPTASSTQTGTIDLSWPAASDDRAVMLSYRIFRDGGSVPIGTVLSAADTPGFRDIGLTPGSTHTYAVDASDGANTGPLSPSSSPTTVAGLPPYIFADDFAGGLTRWTKVIRTSIDPTAGQAAAPSALGSVTKATAYAFHNLGALYQSLCVSANVRLNSLTGNVPLFRIRTASDGPIGRVTIVANRVLAVRSDVAQLTKYSNWNVPIGTWNLIEVCASIGASGTWRLYVNGAPVLATWTANNGTVPMGAISLWDNTLKTFSVNIDDVVVDDHVG